MGGPFPPIAMTPVKRVPDLFMDIYEKLPDLQNVDALLLYEKSQDRIRSETFFDEMMSKSNSMPLHEAFESVLVEMFCADRAVLWEEKSPVYVSQLLHVEIRETLPLVQQLKKERRCVLFDSMNDDAIPESFQPERKSCHLFFSLKMTNGVVIGIVHITRKVPFGEDDEEKAKFIARKFCVYGACAFAQPRTIRDRKSVV